MKTVREILEGFYQRLMGKPKIRSCNIHWDCDQADANRKRQSDEQVAKAAADPTYYLPAWRYALPAVQHCHDEGCSECFGN